MWKIAVACYRIDLPHGALMPSKNLALSPHETRVLELLKKKRKPLTAYDILDQLRSAGIKAPQTVYRALNGLAEKGLAHRIQSLGAFVACRNDEDDHGSQFVVCRACGAVEELHDHRICHFIQEIGEKLKFQIEREMLELIGICSACRGKEPSEM